MRRSKPKPHQKYGGDANDLSTFVWTPTCRASRSACSCWRMATGSKGCRGGWFASSTAFLATTCTQQHASLTAVPTYYLSCAADIVV